MLKSQSTQRYWPLLFLICTLFMLNGCMSSAKNVPSRYSLVFDAVPQINSNAPIKIRVLLLRSDAEFMETDFFTLQGDVKSVLGNSLLDSDQFFLMPGQKGKTLAGQSTLDTRYIGIIAEYRELDGKTWRISLPLPEPKQTNFYKIWQLSPGELAAHIVVGVNGLQADGQKP
ncbi:Type VI secretion lipoprotein/VasD [Chania multitudinisentens RB-25]|uniref:Type VI secretion lipoprotein/VasD n=1 Tax=Chania multitudinisentens RB-25 TaxID=1441930 RepID=W0LEQ1_9GAMM|nr:type VI secretion system lipoprotein TssJ [Chania multitudinisentens]AHG20854.1 Type VI secretion lipoprotein/VasD [Chania multitudinisentens RB-25]